MKKLLGVLFLSLGLSVNIVNASPAQPKIDADYKVLSRQQPVDAPAGKIVVTEFFWLGCPHCAAFDPYLEKWKARQPADVVFNRVPVAFRDDFIPHSRLYHALDSLGVAEKLTPAIFHEIQDNKNYLLTPDAQADFVAKNGVDRQKFLAAYNSFATQNALNRDKALLDDYQIDGVPTLAVQGKYETSPSMTNSLDGTVQVLDFLVAKTRTEMKAASAGKK
ncbi:MAG: thiol:disulfide interchange protein DsbA/DsbL [Janthinobacterium lividum]